MPKFRKEDTAIEVNTPASVLNDLLGEVHAGLDIEGMMIVFTTRAADDPNVTVPNMRTYAMTAPTQVWLCELLKSVAIQRMIQGGR